MKNEVFSILFKVKIDLSGILNYTTRMLRLSSENHGHLRKFQVGNGPFSLKYLETKTAFIQVGDYEYTIYAY